MSISEKDIREREDKYKNLLYSKIEEIISKQSEIIRHIGKTGQYIDIDTDVPNIGITFNNKLIELANEFRRAGISMFADPNEKYNFVDSNFVGTAIIEDMISQLLKGTQVLSEYDSRAGKVTNKRMEKIKALEESGPIKKLFFKIRSFFVPNTVSDLISYSEEEIEEVNSHLLKYKEVDESLWKYNLKDNVVQSLVHYIRNNYSNFTSPGLLEECVIPTLQKLGLEDVIPQLQVELSKEQEHSKSFNNKLWELSPTQKIGVKISQERVGNKVATRENITNNQDIEYSK